MDVRGDGRTRRLSLLCAVALAACGAVASHASAETKQVEFAFADGRINIGQFEGERLVDPAVPERIGSLIGLIETATGNFTAPAGGLVIPDKTFQNINTPAGQTDVVIHFHAIGPIAGNLEPGSGTLRTDQLSLATQISVFSVSEEPGAGMLLARCEVSPVPLPLSSSGLLVDDSDPANPAVYEAVPFTPRGAAVATWESLPASRAIDGPYAPLACPMVDQMAAGPGGVWLAGLADITEAPASGGGTQREKDQAAGKRCKRAKGKRKGKRGGKRRCRKSRNRA